MSYFEYSELINSEKSKLFYSKKTLIFRVLLLFTFVGSLVFLGNATSNVPCNQKNECSPIPIWVSISFVIFILIFIGIALAFMSLNFLITKNLNKQFFTNRHFSSYQAYKSLINDAAKVYDRKVLSIIVYSLIAGFILNSIIMFIYTIIAKNFQESITLGLGVIFMVIAAIIGIIHFINRSKYIQEQLSTNWEKLKV